MRPEAVPAAIPIPIAGTKPWMNSCRLTMTLLPSSPDAVIRMRVSAISDGVEIRSERMISFPPTSCQAIRNSATVASPTTPLAEGCRVSVPSFGRLRTGACAAMVMSGRGSRLGLLPGIRCQHLLGEQIPDALPVGREGWIIADLERARALKRHRNVRDDAARRGAHHDDAVGQIDRLVDVVGHE